MENKFYVGLQRPKELRRNILETSRSTLHALKHFYALGELRQEKLELLNQLKNEVKELNLLMGKLDSALPEHEVIKAKPQKKKTPSKKGKKKAAKKKSKPKKSHMQKLQDSLMDIENKLKNI